MVRIVDNTSRVGFAGIAVLALALGACYGTPPEGTPCQVGSDDCQAGDLSTDISTLQCVATLSDGGLCGASGTCQQPVCYEDSDCGPGFVCALGCGFNAYCDPKP